MRLVVWRMQGQRGTTGRDASAASDEYKGRVARLRRGGVGGCGCRGPSVGDGRPAAVLPGVPRRRPAGLRVGWRRRHRRRVRHERLSLLLIF